jgi:hypothetical protein
MSEMILNQHRLGKQVFRLIGQIRLSPNKIKNNFHWEIADGRWELGRKAGIASAG